MLQELISLFRPLLFLFSSFDVRFARHVCHRHQRLRLLPQEFGCEKTFLRCAGLGAVLLLMLFDWRLPNLWRPIKRSSRGSWGSWIDYDLMEHDHVGSLFISSTLRVRGSSRSF